jgi:uncharacterized protein
MFSLKNKDMLSTQTRKIGNSKKSLSAAILAAAIFAVAFNSYTASAQTMLSNIFWYISPSDPYLQNWSDTVSINADDNWDNFISINGYSGDGLTATAGVNPQTVLADGSGTPVDVIANQSNPNTLTIGGVAEFDGIANPTVALKGSDTADAPHLVIRINTKSCPDTKFMTVGYKVRDLDSTANNAVQQVALQYRLNDTGNYTNVPSAFVADATDPNAATKVSTVFSSLPQTVLQQDRLYLRIMTTNASGTDEWVGIDDISVGCFLPTSARATVSGTVSDSSGSKMANTTVLMTDPVGNIRSVKTNSFGNFQFDTAAIGAVYILEVRSKSFTYTPQVVIVSSDLSGIDFIPQSGAGLRSTAKSPFE